MNFSNYIFTLKGIYSILNSLSFIYYIIYYKFSFVIISSYRLFVEKIKFYNIISSFYTYISLNTFSSKIISSYIYYSIFYLKSSLILISKLFISYSVCLFNSSVNFCF